MNSEKFFVVSRLDFLTIVLKKYVNIFRNDVFSKIYIRYRILFWGATLWFTVQLINGKGKFYIFERIDKWNSHIKYFNSQSSSSILSNLTCKSCNLQNDFSVFPTPSVFVKVFLKYVHHCLYPWQHSFLHFHYFLSHEGGSSLIGGVCWFTSTHAASLLL